MKKKCEIIREIAENCNKEGEKHICILTKRFKAKGYLHTEKEIEGLITLTNAKIKPLSGECECDIDDKTLEWLNIFADDIIAFSFE